jgi:hypothetical protein
MRMAAFVVSTRDHHSYNDVLRVNFSNVTFLAGPIDEDSVSRSQHGWFLKAWRNRRRQHVPSDPGGP